MNAGKGRIHICAYVNLLNPLFKKIKRSSGQFSLFAANHKSDKTKEEAEKLQVMVRWEQSKRRDKPGRDQRETSVPAISHSQLR